MISPHDARPPRSSGGTSSTGNVLRTIGNSFIPNTQINNIPSNTTTTSTGHVFR